VHSTTTKPSVFAACAIASVAVLTIAAAPAQAATGSTSRFQTTTAVAPHAVSARSVHPSASRDGAAPRTATCSLKLSPPLNSGVRMEAVSQVTCTAPVYEIEDSVLLAYLGTLESSTTSYAYNTSTLTVTTFGFGGSTLVWWNSSSVAEVYPTDPSTYTVLGPVNEAG
jgi:hypothetical protein